MSMIIQSANIEDGGKLFIIFKKKRYDCFNHIPKVEIHL